MISPTKAPLEVFIWMNECTQQQRLAFYCSEETFNCPFNHGRPYFLFCRLTNNPCCCSCENKIKKKRKIIEMKSNLIKCCCNNKWRRYYDAALHDTHILDVSTYIGKQHAPASPQKQIVVVELPSMFSNWINRDTNKQCKADIATTKYQK